MSSLKEISPAEQRFATDAEHLRQQGGDLSLIVAVAPMLMGKPKDFRDAATFVMKHRTSPMVDPDDADEAIERADVLRQAKQMVLRAGYKPTPAHIVGEFTPGDAALMKRLDAATGQSYKATQFEQPKAAPKIDLSVSTGGRGRASVTRREGFGPDEWDV